MEREAMEKGRQKHVADDKVLEREKSENDNGNDDKHEDGPNRYKTSWKS